MFNGFGTYGEPIRQSTAEAHHLLDIPYVLGPGNMSCNVDEAVGEPSRGQSDEYRWSRFDDSFLRLLNRPDVACDLVGPDLHRLMFDNARDRVELLRRMRETTTRLRSERPMHCAPPWTINDPHIITDVTRMHAEALWDSDVRERQRKQSQFITRELSHFAVVLNLLPLTNPDWKLSPPIRKTIRCGNKTRVIFIPATVSDWMILRLLNCVLQHAFVWPESSHGCIPRRGVHTAMLQLGAHLRQNFRFACTLDIVDAYPSTHRIRAVQKIASCCRHLHHEGCIRAEKSNSLKWLVGADTGEAENLIQRVFDVAQAFDWKTSKLVPVGDCGLLQGLSVSPVGFNLVFRALDFKLMARFEKSETWVIRYADNFIILSRYPEAIPDTIEVIRDYCRGFSLDVRQETEPVDLFAQGSAIDFLGLTISPVNESTPMRVSTKKINDLAIFIRHESSANRLVAGVKAFFRYYGPPGYIDDCCLELLAVKAKEALHQNAALAHHKRVETLVSIQGLAKFRARTMK